MRIAFAMIDMPHWRERRARGECFEKLYDALHGYSYCFDPYVLSVLNEVPSLVERNHLLARLSRFDCLVSPSRELTEALHPRWPSMKPALWVDPPPGLAARFVEDDSPTPVLALKERLRFIPEQRTPAFLIERDFNTRAATGFWPFSPDPRDTVIGQVGERPIWLVRGPTGYASIANLFRWSYLTFAPENMAAFVTGFIRALYAALGRNPDEVPPSHWRPDSLRQDFHAFGITLAFLEYGLREDGGNAAELKPSWEPLLSAARAAVKGNEDKSRRHLRVAFEVLRTIRQKHFPFERGWIDIPHAGILGPDCGLAELEWPELTRDYLAYMADLAETTGYRFSLEYNTGAWVETARRHPLIVKRLGRLWRAGQIDLVNGSWSGPLQQYTNIELAAREFELGQAATEKLFGRRCETYACQEFSFMPSFPGLLRDFGYRRVVHVAQNRGETPASRHNHFGWQGKDGRRIAALGHHQLDLAKRGVNFYIEWPTMFIGCLKQGRKRLDSVCMQDQSPLQFREDMIRAGRYAPVLGHHRIVPDVLSDGPDTSLPVETFRFDRYLFEQSIAGPICPHWISVFEQVLGYAHRITRAEKLATAAGLPVATRLKPVWEWLLYLESHDHLLVPGGRPGDFYYRGVIEFSGPQFGNYGLNFGRVLMSRQAEMETVLREVEDESLSRLGLRRLVPHRIPHTIHLHSPHPQPLGPGGWFPWEGRDFQAAGESGRLRTWNGRAYWAGQIPPVHALELKARPVRALHWSARSPRGGDHWSLCKGPGQSLVAVSPGNGTTLRIMPEDGRKLHYRLKQVRYAGDSRLSVTRVVWSAVHPAKGETVVQADLVQLEGCPLVFVHTDVNGFNPGGPSKEHEALRLRFLPAGPLKEAHYFVSHFTESSRKRVQTSSPYVALARTAKGTLSILNRGSIWHLRQKNSLDLVLMVPHEKVSHRDFAFAWNLDHPVATALRQLDEPLLVSLSRSPARLPRIVGCNLPNIWISSLRPDGQMRVSETDGIRSEVLLTVNPRPAGVRFLGERGMLDERPSIQSDGTIRFILEPWESAALQMAG